MLTLFPRFRGWLAVTALVTAVTPALAEKGLGPLYQLYYEPGSITEVVNSDGDEVEVSFQDITTYNCRGCDVQWLAYGQIYHFRNLTKRPLCVTMNFTVADDRANQWGSGQTYYLKPGQRLQKVGGVYDYSDGDNSVEVDTSFRWTLNVADPVAKNRCPS